MGLEAANFISGLVTTNPTSTDKKNQGDDHFRLMKTVLQNNFPGSDHAFYIPHVTTLSVDTILTEAGHGGYILFIDTSGGARTITLPTPSFAAWQIEIMKSSADNNPVFIVPPSGTINGWPKIRIGVPFRSARLIWTGSSFVRHTAAGEPYAGTVEWAGIVSVPNGYLLANNASLLRVDYPELFGSFGTAYGAVDGTHFSLPNLLDKFPVGAGSTYGPGSTGGENTHVLSVGEMPAHQHGGTTGNESAFHQHSGGVTGITPLICDGVVKAASLVTSGNTGSQNAFHTHDFLTNFQGGGAAHENRPPYFGLYPIIRAC